LALRQALARVRVVMVAAAAVPPQGEMPSSGAQAAAMELEAVKALRWPEAQAPAGKVGRGDWHRAVAAAPA
jgi:hypothetical protein